MHRSAFHEQTLELHPVCDHLTTTGYLHISHHDLDLQDPRPELDHPSVPLVCIEHGSVEVFRDAAHYPRHHICDRLLLVLEFETFEEDLFGEASEYHLRVVLHPLCHGAGVASLVRHHQGLGDRSKVLIEGRLSDQSR